MILRSTVLLLSLSWIAIASSANAAEIEGRAGQVKVKLASVDRDADEVTALRAIFKSVPDFNGVVKAAEPPSSKATLLAVKALPAQGVPARETELVRERVFDHYEPATAPVYRDVWVERAVESGSAR